MASRIKELGLDEQIDKMFKAYFKSHAKDTKCTEERVIAMIRNYDLTDKNKNKETERSGEATLAAICHFNPYNI